MKRRKPIQATEFLHAVSHGKTKRQLMKIFGLSASGLDGLFEQMIVEKSMRAHRIAADFRSGMPSHQIAERNGFRVEKFDQVLQKIRDLGVFHDKEADAAHSHQAETAPVFERRARARLNHPVLVTKVSEANLPERCGMISDLSEMGLRIEGIRAGVNEKKLLVMKVGHSVESGSLVFEGQCRWISAEEDADRQSAGFEIVSISETSLGLLRVVLSVEFSLVSAT